MSNVDIHCVLLLHMISHDSVSQNWLFHNMAWADTWCKLVGWFPHIHTIMHYQQKRLIIVKLFHAAARVRYNAWKQEFGDLGFELPSNNQSWHDSLWNSGFPEMLLVL